MNTQQLQDMEQVETFAGWLARIMAAYVEELQKERVPEPVITMLAAQFQNHLLSGQAQKKGT